MMTLWNRSVFSLGNPANPAGAGGRRQELRLREVSSRQEKRLEWSWNPTVGKQRKSVSTPLRER
jgi:hypothetical protein